MTIKRRFSQVLCEHTRNDEIGMAGLWNVNIFGNMVGLYAVQTRAQMKEKPVTVF